MANSRGPETTDAEALEFGAHAVTAADAVQGKDVIVLSIPFGRIPAVAPLFASVPGQTVVIDTSNYMPHRDGAIEAVDNGQVESLWVTEQLGRPVVKAWNAVLSQTFQAKTPAYCTDWACKTWRRPFTRPTGTRPRATGTA
ncbi:NADPH-dependent F420 reductase [Streptomyces coeruleorubidus]|uniref:NADPH-dependent F420 reductase n=1 Tax=Streptomyces coeruleorubidus TaxID=116188 RepID=UPI0033A1F989